MENIKEIHRLDSHEACVWCVSWNYDGTLLASCSGDKSIRIWSFVKVSQKWECIFVLDYIHSKTVRCVAWSTCGNFLASASFDGKVSIEKMIQNNPIEFETVTSLESHNFEIKSVSWSANGQFLASCARDKTVQIWEIDEYDNLECAETLYSHTQDVKSVKWHPIHNILVSSSYDNSIKIYKEQLDEWTEVASLNGHLSTVWNVEFNCDGNILASCSDDKTVRLWISTNSEFSRWVCASLLSGYHEDVIYDLSWQPSSNVLATVGGDRTICVLRISPDCDNTNLSVELLTTAKAAHDQDINCCTWKPATMGSALLATGSDDMSIKLWQFYDPDMPID